MEYVLGLAQVVHPAKDDTVSVMEGYMEKAHAQDVDIIVFPEGMMCHYDEVAHRFTRDPEPIDGSFASAICQLARKFNMWCVFTMIEKSEQTRPYNTAVVADNQGIVRAKYRKMHLFNSDFTRESDRILAGSENLTPIATPFGKLGLAICHDLRFPEQARAAYEAGCDLFLYPAAWYDGKTKALQWETLLGARAIENKMTVAGICCAGDDFVGQSCVFAPNGIALAQAGPEECLLTCRISY